MRRALALAWTCSLAMALAGCAERAERPEAAPRTKIFEIADYALYRRGYSGTGSSLRRVDPATLRPLTRRGLRLGGYAYDWAFSPDRRVAAFGLEFGELVLVDLARERITGRVYLGNAERSVRPVGWPRPDLLVVHTCNDAGKYGCLDNRLVLVDPQRLRRRVEVALPGHPEVAYGSRSRRSVFLVTDPDEGLQPARLVVVEPRGLVREIHLARIRVGVVRRARGPHRRSAALALDAGRAIVFGADDLVAEVPLGSLRVRYHRVRGLDVPARSFRRAPTRRWGGTTNPNSSEGRVVERLRPGAVVVGGWATLLVRGGVREARLPAHVLSTRTWRARPARRFEGGERVGSFRLVATGTVDERGYHGPFSLSAFDGEGRRVWRLRFRTYFTWTSFAPFVYAGLGDGRMNRVYDLRTGRLLRRVRPTDVEPALRWTPPG